MHPTTRRLPWLVFLALASVMTACSSDDGDPADPDDGDPGTGDMVAPRVTSVQPSDGSVDVDQWNEITVQFSESMDTSTASGQFTLSHGGVTEVQWLGDNMAQIGHDEWPQGTEITFTIGTGLTDLAGNALAAPVQSTFWTWSDELSLLEHLPADGAVDVDRAAFIELMFSSQMEPSSIETGVTIDDGSKSALEFTVASDDGVRFVLDPVEFLPSNTGITVTVGMGVQSIHGIGPAAPITFGFTTGETVDETPPTITAFDPPSGSTLAADLGVLTIEFSEPIDPDTFGPVYLNGQLQWVIDQAPEEPYFNAAGDLLTVPLPAELPAGLPLEVAFAGYADPVGNVQTSETVWTGTVAGTADPYPVSHDARFLMIGQWSAGELGNSDPSFSDEEWIWFRFAARSAADRWNREEYLDGEYTMLDYYEIQAVDAAGVRIVGVAENDGGSFDEYFLSTPLAWAEYPLSVGDTWSGTSSVTFPDGTIDVSMSGEILGREDLAAGMIDDAEIVWTDVWRLLVEIEISAGGTTLSTESTESWYASGVGVVREMYREDNYEEGDEGWFETDRRRAIGPN